LLDDLDGDAVRPRVRSGDLARGLVEVDRAHRGEAELRGRDREHAGPTADVEQARRLGFLEELETQTGRGMGAGAEGAARVDHDCQRAVRRLVPGRTDPEPADADAVMEVAPGVLPALLDIV